MNLEEEEVEEEVEGEDSGPSGSHLGWRQCLSKICGKGSLVDALV